MRKRFYDRPQVSNHKISGLKKDKEDFPRQYN